jgi:hypothetical protein
MSDRSESTDDAAPPDASAWTVDGEYAFLGRTFEEYVRLFDLDPEALVGRRVLDCPSGPASFVAEGSTPSARTWPTGRLRTRSSAGVGAISRTRPPNTGPSGSCSTGTSTATS